LRNVTDGSGKWIEMTHASGVVERQLVEPSAAWIAERETIASEPRGRSIDERLAALEAKAIG